MSDVRARRRRRPASLLAQERPRTAAVRPGGTLLIVGHHPSDLDTSVGRPNLPGFLFTADEIAAARVSRGRCMNCAETRSNCCGDGSQGENDGHERGPGGDGILEQLEPDVARTQRLCGDRK